MILRNTRLEAFANLGKYINDPANSEEIEEWIADSNSKNNWFTIENVKMAIDSISNGYLNEDALTSWLALYHDPSESKKIGVVMAGNIPAVGFHDALSVLVSGHTLLAKTSSDDPVLIKHLFNKLIDLEPAFEPYVRFVDRLNEADAYIATGSDNTARYFHYYFANKPNIIRKNRTSVAILNGEETTEDYKALGNDIFQYYGLGCRNVSKLYVPEGYDFTKFYDSIESFSRLGLTHHKYFNNYEYNKSILLVNGIAHLDNGFLILTESNALVSPISVVHYQTYSSQEQLASMLEENAEKIQCIVAGTHSPIKNSIPFGAAQRPGLTDYADSVDTMQFLSEM